MGLSCECDFDDDGPGDFYVEDPDKYERLLTNKRKRCKSCKDLIDRHALCAKIHRWRYPKSDIEEAIKGFEAEIYLAPWILCEGCADIYFSLRALKVCVDLCDNVSLGWELEIFNKDYAPKGFTLKPGYGCPPKPDFALYRGNDGN